MPRRRRLSREEIEAELGTTGGFMIPLRPGRRSGLIWVALLVLIAVLALVGGLPGGGSGVDLRRALEPFPASPAATGSVPTGGAAIARDVQQTWRELFRRAGTTFRAAKLVAVDRVRKSRCGLSVPKGADAFYCERDRTVSFSGDDAYAIAHAYAHHVQSELGITEQIARAVEASPSQARELWLEHEQQAACLAGVWAHSAGVVDVTTIPLVPDHDADVKSWAEAPRGGHEEWFRRGSERGLAQDCNVFAGTGA